MNSINTTLLIILSFAVGFLVSTYILPEKEIVIRELLPNSVHVDTIIKIVKSKPIIIEKIKTRIKWKTDTIIKTAPFEALVDTVIARDTVWAMFEYPENLFSLRVSKAPDSLEVQKMIITKIIKLEAPWWETPAYITVGTVLGFLLSSTIK